jgi:hypothetical protein
MKIVINDCYGGFSLSYEAMALYLATKFKQAYFYAELRGSGNGRSFKRIPFRNLKTASQSYYFIYCTTEDQGEELDHFPTNIFNDREVDRTDPDLISVIEFLGPKAASGRYAQLKIKEILDGTMYRIDHYDGYEEIQFRDNIGWEIADSHNQSTPVDPNLLHIIYDNYTRGELS